LLSDADLKRVPRQAKPTDKGNPYGMSERRPLDNKELKNAKDFDAAAAEANNGNPARFDNIKAQQKWRPHKHDKGEFKGWTSLDLDENKSGYDSKMRFMFRQANGKYQVMIVQIH
jgi:hypothetical protein